MASARAMSFCQNSRGPDAPGSRQPSPMMATSDGRPSRAGFRAARGAGAASAVPAWSSTRPEPSDTSTCRSAIDRVPFWSAATCPIMNMPSRRCVSADTRA